MRRFPMEDMKKNSDPGINRVLMAAIDLNPSVPSRLEKIILQPINNEHLKAACYPDLLYSKTTKSISCFKPP